MAWWRINKILVFPNERMQRDFFSWASLHSWQNYGFGFPSIKKLPLLNSSVMSRSSKWHWMLQFYIVWERCLLDMPYHKYHLFLISGLHGPVRFWLKFISKELRGGLSFTVEAWQQEGAVTEPSQSRPGKITPRFQWHNSQNQSSSQQSFSLLREMRDVGGLQRDHIPSSSVRPCDEMIQQISDSLLIAGSHVMRTLRI